MTDAMDRLKEFRQFERRERLIYREDCTLLLQLGFQNKLPIGQKIQSVEP